jgi:hypothetical protein
MKNSSLDARNLVFFIFLKLLMRAIHLLVYYLLYQTPRTQLKIFLRQSETANAILIFLKVGIWGKCVVRLVNMYNCIAYDRTDMKNSSLDARNLVFFIFLKLLMRAIHLLVYYLLFELLIALSASCTGTCFIRKIYAPSSSLLQGKHLPFTPSPEFFIWNA